MSSSTRVILDPKRVAEIRTYTFDFISQLGASETILTQVVSAAVWSGVDAAPSGIISGSATAAGTIVSQKTTGGVLGVIYTLTCTVTTSAGQTLTLVGQLAIIPVGL